jgi:hypothetical protein
MKLINLAEIPIVKVTLLKLDRNPYKTGDIEYFDKRREKLIHAKFRAASTDYISKTVQFVASLYTTGSKWIYITSIHKNPGENITWKIFYLYTKSAINR